MDGIGTPAQYTGDDVLAAIGQAVIVTDPAGIVRSWNAAAERLYGWSEAEVLGRPIGTLTVSEVSRRDPDDILAALRAGEPWSGGFTVRHRDGSSFRALVTTTGVRSTSGDVVALVGVSTAMGDAMQPLLEDSIDAALVVGLDGFIRFASPAVSNVYGWSPNEVVGQSVMTLLHAEDAPVLARALAACDDGSGSTTLEVRVRGRDGLWRWSDAAIADHVADPSVRAVIIHLRDVTDRLAAAQRVTRLALHDPLTGLANRAMLADRIRHGQSRRADLGALLLFDLDDFKAVNRSMGHNAGDDLIRGLAQRLDRALSAEDTCARLGGDELVALVEGVETPEQALALASRLQALLQRSARAGGTLITPSASVGVTMLAGRRRVDELLRECVAAVHQAKQAGSGRVVMFQSLGAQSSAAGGLVPPLRQGLADGEVRVFYQPVVDLGSRAVVGVEALVRWAHPELGLLPAEDFIEAAESDDLIHDLGAFVLSEACHQVASWPGPAHDLAVNVSARQLCERSLARTVQDCLSSSRLAAGRLVLEITETALMQDLATALDVLAECRAQGVRISLDDFGTGFAGFGYLRELPVDEVKIDRSFVTGLTASTFDRAIVTGIVQMARGLGLRTTGEGVETPRQAHTLTELGCDRAQGHLWSRAVAGAGHAPPVAGDEVAPLRRVSP